MAARPPHSTLDESSQTLDIAGHLDAEVRDAVEEMKLRRRPIVSHEDESLRLVGVLSPEPREELEPIHVPQDEVAKHEVEATSDGDDCQGIGARADCDEIVLDEGIGEVSAETRLIVDDEHAAAASGPVV
jgi:hypothetical protein